MKICSCKITDEFRIEIKKALIKSIAFSTTAMVMTLTRFYLNSRNINRMLPALQYLQNIDIDWNVVNFRIGNISTWRFIIPHMILVMGISYVLGFCINLAILYISAWLRDEPKK